uniref:Peptidase S1 domain-containing protein n=1 Tax=Nothoprocta perdicaria TaxID=30464 RepID=A0A8C7EDE2_NOTPE
MLLRLDRPVRFGGSVKKIRLATRCPTGGMRCSVSGWGTTKSPGGANWRAPGGAGPPREDPPQLCSGGT